MQVDLIGSAIWLVIFIMSAIFHEVAHGYAAYALGDPTAKSQGRLSFNPLRHLEPMGSFIVPAITYVMSSGSMIFGWAKPVPYNPYNLSDQRRGELKVALAGPATNLILAALLGLIFRIIVPEFGEGGMVTTLVLIAIQANLVLGIFNLIPVPPLDGSKILFGLLPYRFERYRNMAEQWSIFLILFVVFFAWDVIYPLITGLFQLFTGL